MVALHTVEAFGGSTEAPEDVAAAYHNAYLHTHIMHFLYLAGIVSQTLGVDAVALLAHKTLTGELEQYSLKSCHIVVLFFT